MSKPDTYMPLVIGDYLKDTSRLSCEEHGAYLLLLIDYWVSGPLPDNDRHLAAICRLSMSKWLRVRQTLAPFFWIDGGMWNNKRADAERARAFIKSNKARASADARWKGNANAMRTHNRTQCSPSPYISSSKKPTKPSLVPNPALDAIVAKAKAAGSA